MEGSNFFDFLVSYENQLLFVVSPCNLIFPPILLQKATILPPSVWTRIHMDSNLKEELTDLLWKLLGIPYSHRQSANGNITTPC